MNDILTRLPPDTVITGQVGDHGSYCSYKLTAATARERLTVGIENQRAYNAVNQPCPTCGAKQYARCYIDQLDRGLITFMEPNERYAEICALTPSCPERIAASVAAPWFTGEDVKATLPNGVILFLNVQEVLGSRGDVRTDPWVVIGVDMVDAVTTLQETFASNMGDWSQPGAVAREHFLRSLRDLAGDLRQYL